LAVESWESLSVQRLGPGESGPFPLRVKLRFVPGVQEKQPVLRLAQPKRVLPVHMQAMRAAVHLGHAHPDEFEQLRIEALLDPGLNSDKALYTAVF
jgi:hypothetical protein